MIFDEILAAIEIFDKLSATLAAAQARAAAGGSGELTPDERAALDAANELRKNQLLASIAARVGPDTADAPAVGDSFQNEKTAREQAGG